MHNRLAKLAFDVIQNAPIRGTEAENVVAVKQWLKQIANGQLVVGTPVKEDVGVFTEPQNEIKP